MWTLIVTLLLWVTSATSGLESNIIRSSKEITDSPQEVKLPTVDVSILNTMKRRQHRRDGPECTLEQVNRCKGTKKRQRHGGKTGLSPEDASQEKVQERGECLRSSDCAEGMCCVLYRRTRRCQRIPREDEFCLLPGRRKARRELGLCDCRPGLHCRHQTNSSNVFGVCQV
ncbi:uncharacterized protein LOC143491408 isoform X2 [Brachyhypopomus gauderio]|uniref:uncharacterized protein LOC143491408 isoform X2 n=1 Tax=Brachyhypopomus gauderio TaxID=698409 RepID=UPI0040413FAE